MCVEVAVNKKGSLIFCGTVGELADALEVPRETVSDDPPPECCLCNAKLDYFGARRATDEEGWPSPEYIVDFLK